MITRKQYMENSAELHDVYYLQFAINETKDFILAKLKIKDIEQAIANGDVHLNKIKIPYNNMGIGGGWWWDDAPINTSLLKEAGESNSQSTHTSVAKALAKSLINVKHNELERD
jgi:hypothetical protein